MADIGRVGGRVVAGAHDQQGVARRPEDEFRPGHDLRREGIGEIRGDEADQVGGPAPEALGNGVGLIAELRGRAQDPVRKAGITSPRPEKTLETVEIATPARCATSRIRSVGGLGRSGIRRAQHSFCRGSQARHRGRLTPPSPIHSMPWSSAKRFAKRFFSRPLTFRDMERAGREVKDGHSHIASRGSRAAGRHGSAGRRLAGSEGQAQTSATAGRRHPGRFASQ